MTHVRVLRQFTPCYCCLSCNTLSCFAHFSANAYPTCKNTHTVCPGGLDGTFLVLKLEEMASQARSAFGSSCSTTAVATPLSDATTADGKDPAADGGAPVPVKPTVDGNIEATTAVAAASASDDKPKSVSKSGRRVHRVAVKATPTVADGTAGDTRPTGRVGDDVGREASQEEDVTVVAPTAASPTGVDAEADADSRAEALRAEKNAQQLKWADEVSAAASAAVAAAAALSQAKKDQPKEESSAKATDASSKHGVSFQTSELGKGIGSSQDAGARANVAAASKDEAEKCTSAGKSDDAASQAAAVAPADTAGATVGVVIDLGGVGDDEAEGEMVAAVASTATATEAEGDSVSSKQTLDANETGIVIAKDPSATNLPRWVYWDRLVFLHMVCFECLPARFRYCVFFVLFLPSCLKNTGLSATFVLAVQLALLHVAVTKGLLLTVRGHISCILRLRASAGPPWCFRLFKSQSPRTFYVIDSVDFLISSWQE